MTELPAVESPGSVKEAETERVGSHDSCEDENEDGDEDVHLSSGGEDKHTGAENKEEHTGTDDEDNDDAEEDSSRWEGVHTTTEDEEHTSSEHDDEPASPEDEDEDEYDDDDDDEDDKEEETCAENDGADKHVLLPTQRMCRRWWSKMHCLNALI